MGTSETPSRKTLLDSLQDYVKQLREEGMDGLPGVAAQTSARPAADITTTARSARAVPHQSSSAIQLPDPNPSTAQRNSKRLKPDSPSPAPPAINRDPSSRYPGLDSALSL